MKKTEREVVSEGLKERDRQKRQTKREQHGDRKRGRRETDEAQLRGSPGLKQTNKQRKKEMGQRTEMNQQPYCHYNVKQLGRSRKRKL